MLQDMNRVVIIVVTLGIFGAFLRALPPRVMRLQRPLSFLFKRNKNKTKNMKVSLVSRENLEALLVYSLKVPKPKKANKSTLTLFKLNKS